VPRKRPDGTRAPNGASAIYYRDRPATQPEHRLPRVEGAARCRRSTPGYTTRGTGPRRFAAGSARPDRNGDHGVIDGHVPPL